MCEQEPIWWNNFEFTINRFKYEMINGFLTIDDVLYEESACPETYALARAYYKLAISVT